MKIFFYDRAVKRAGKGICMSIQVLNAGNFDEHINGADKPIIVDFYADWCGPCKMIAPMLEELAKEQAGAVDICKINVDNDSAIAARFSVQSIPTLISFKDGQVYKTMVGAGSKAKILDLAQ